MKNVLGNSITVTLFGESHGEQIGAVIDGIAPGIEVDIDFMRKQLELRKPHGKISCVQGMQIIRQWRNIMDLQIIVAADIFPEESQLR